MRILGAYQKDIAVVGGWVPELLLTQADVKHVGSIDVDLVLNHQNMNEAGYETILALLLSHGYIQGNQPFIFHRTVVLDDHEIQVEVDFLAGEYAGTGKSHRTQRTQDMQPRKARGADLVFMLPEKIIIHGRLPEGGDDSTEIQVASIPAFLVMKAFALNNRLKEKDSWDIYYCVRYYPGGVEALIDDFRPLQSHGLAQEALSYLASKFSSPTAVGPIHVANFEEITDPEDRAFIQRDAYERIQYLIRNLRVEH
jgi:hypothetical protein